MFGLFKKRKTETILDNFNAVTAKMYRGLMREKNISDEQIIEIVQLVMKKFQSAAESKGETISGTALVNIAAKFVKVYDISSPEFFMEHLRYEINRYMTSGLRDDYAKSSIFSNGKENIQSKAGIHNTSIQQGNAKEQYELAVLYENGIGVTKDIDQALFLYDKAAEQGHVTAQNHLGVVYSQGTVITGDDAKAVFWFRKAAEQGDLTAQNNLGLCYAEGTGVARDDAQAVFWYHKAAEQGYVDAQRNLSVMYGTGKGVKLDLSQAVVWLRKAANQGDVNCQEALNKLGV